MKYTGLQKYRLGFVGILSARDIENEKAKNDVLEETKNEAREFLAAWRIPEDTVADFFFLEGEGPNGMFMWFRSPDADAFECTLVMTPKK